MTWLTANLGTIFVSAVLILAVIGIVKGLHENKKQGKNSCGGNCANCHGCHHGG